MLLVYSTQVVSHHLRQLASLEDSLAAEKLRQRMELQMKLEAQRMRMKEVRTQQALQSHQRLLQHAPLPSPRADLLARCCCSRPLSKQRAHCFPSRNNRPFLLCRFSALSDGLERTLAIERLRQAQALLEKRCPIRKMIFPRLTQVTKGIACARKSRPRVAMQLPDLKPVGCSR